MSVFWAAFTIFSVAGGLGEARNLAQAPSPTQAVAPEYTAELYGALMGNASESGPILYKTFEAAYYSILAETKSSSSLGISNQTATFGNDSTLLVAWDAGNASLILAFATSDRDNSSLTETVSTLSPVAHLNDFFGGSPPTANPVALNLFNGIINNITASNGAISSVSNGVNSTSVGRVLCTGHGGGAALAQLCGPWAQISYPASQVRVITFGGPRVADDKHDWALQQLVDLPYLWMTDADNRTIAQQPSGPVRQSNVTRVIPSGNATASGEPGSIQYYTTLLNNTLKANGSAIPITIQTNFSYGYLPGGRDTQFVASAAPQGGGFFSRVQNAIGTATDTISAAGSVISNFVGDIFGGSDAPAPAPAAQDISQLAPSSSQGSQVNSRGGVQSASTRNTSNDCTPMLCKLKPAISAACASYSDGASLGPGSITVTADNTSTNVAVAWNADTKVATFAWRGSQENEDWIQNLKLRFSTDDSSEFFTELYKGTRVYQGELNQFRAVTDQAQNDSVSIRAQLERISNGSTPSRIDCIGHSLGGGLATLCGPWASEEWPTADVRVVTFGSPKAGNMQLAESLYATVGRIYRAVNSRDAVPSLPPFSRYLHSNFALWLNNSKIYADDRLPTEISDLTWDDHGCEDQYTTAIQQAANLTIPEWVKSLT